MNFFWDAGSLSCSMHSGNISIRGRKLQEPSSVILDTWSAQSDSGCEAFSLNYLLLFYLTYTALVVLDWWSHHLPDVEFLASALGSCGCKIRTCCLLSMTRLANLMFLGGLPDLWSTRGPHCRLHSDLWRQIATSGCLVDIVFSFISQLLPDCAQLLGLLFFNLCHSQAFCTILLTCSLIFTWIYHHYFIGFCFPLNPLIC